MLHNSLSKKTSPYLVGFGIGLLALLSFFLFHKIIGTSTTFVKLSALLWAAFNPSYVAESPYYREYLYQKPLLDWQFLLVFGLFIGAFLSSRLSKTKQKTLDAVPSIWKNRFGPSSLKRYIGAFFGGVLVLFGARLAGGCTSGHAISGGFQLALSGWLFMLGVFAIGIPTALLLYRKGKSL